MDAGSSNNATDIFVYMGEDSEVPRDVVSVRIHPSVKVIPNGAFRDRKQLKMVNISEGVIEIGQYAFSHTMMDMRFVLHRLLNIFVVWLLIMQRQGLLFYRRG